MKRNGRRSLGAALEGSRRLYAIAPLVLALASSPDLTRAQTPASRLVDSARVEIDRAVAASDSARLARTVALLDRALVEYPDDPYLLHYRGYAGYRQAASFFIANNVGAAGPVVQRALKDLARSGEKLLWPETFALAASLTGFAIAVDPSRGMELGAEAGALQARAMQLGPRNPRVWLIGGIVVNNTPPEYGGSTEKAKEMLKKASDLFATDTPSPLAPAWGRDQALAWLKRLDGGPARP